MPRARWPRRPLASADLGLLRKAVLPKALLRKALLRKAPLRMALLRKASRWLWTALIVLGISHSVAAQQRRWAALDPNGEGSSSVAWGATEEEARQRAVEACRNVSQTCANGPASTHDLNEVFAIVCCALPRRGCAAAAAANRREAAQNVQEMFAGAGYKDCSVQHYISAATGKRQ